MSNSAALGALWRRCALALAVAGCACSASPPTATPAAASAAAATAAAVTPPAPTAAAPAASPSAISPSASPAISPRSEGPVVARFTEPLVARSETRAIVLLYHSIDHGLTPRSVWPWDLEAQIVRLRRNHTEIIKLSQLVAFLTGDIERLPARVAVLTIDDGEVLLHKHAWPVFRKHRVPFAIGVITQPTEMAGYAPALSWKQLGEMVASGLCEIASHGHTHTGLTALDTDEEIDFELNHSRELIEQHLGIAPVAFIYPLGAWNEAIIARVKAAGYPAAFGVAGRSVDSATTRYAIPRFEMRQRTSLTAMSVFFEVRNPPR